MDVKIETITEEQVRECSKQLISKIKKDKFYPSVIIGSARGGLIPAQYLAYGMDVKHIESLSVQLRDNTELNTLNEINALLDKLVRKYKKYNDKINILIVDDLVDSGDTIKQVRTLLHHKNLEIRIAVLYQNTKISNEKNIRLSDYWGKEKPQGWLNFPWDTISN